MRLAALALVLVILSPASALEFYFSPNGGAEARVVKMLDGAKSEVRVMIYCINSPAITDALVRAKRRGVDVRMVCDYVQAAGKSSTDERLVAAGIPIFSLRGTGGGVMHVKALVVDRKAVAWGSFNFTTPAEHKNDEALCVEDADAPAARQFLSKFESLWTRGTRLKK